MDTLRARIGERPYKLSQLYTLRSDVAFLMETVNPGNSFDKAAAIEMIEILEAFASKLRFARDYLFPDLQEDPNGLPWGDSGRINRDIHYVFTSLITDITKYKTRLFQALELPDLIHSDVDCATICQYCNWVLERIDRGWQVFDAKKRTIKDTYRYLCVSDSYPEFPVLEARAKSGCEFCGFLRENLLSGVTSENDFIFADAEHPAASNVPGVAVEDDQLNVDLDVALDKNSQLDSKSEIADYSGDFDERGKERVHVWFSFEWINKEDEVLWHTIGGLRCVFLSPWRHQSRNFPEKFSFMVESSDETLRSLFRVYESPQESPLAPANLDFLQRQVEKGTRGIQNEISDTENSTYMPRRLLDLGSSSESCPKLAIFPASHINAPSNNQERDTDFRYATLSYSWGSPEDAELQLKLTALNFEDLLRTIPFEIMSPVMRDAVVVCRVLHVRYLWIDALCIRQHDKQDWEEQSAEMSKVYGNSWLTICAASSSSCQQGFLGKREHRSSIRLGYCDHESGSVKATYILRRLHGATDGESRYHPNVFPTVPGFSRDLELSSWFKRGWVFQEKTLSKRKLIFGASMIHWEQGDYQVSENGETRKRPPRDSSALTTESIRRKGKGIYDFWLNIIEEFCFLNWTENLDLFPALSGVATLFQEATDDEYIAGLWLKDLYCGLLWTSRPGENPAQNLGDLLSTLHANNMKLAPSWSWAGTAYFSEFAISDHIGTTCRVRTHLRQDFTLTKSTISIDGANRLGRLNYASLHISGKAIAFPVEFLPEKREWLCKTPDGHILYVEPDWHGPESNRISEEEGAQLHCLLISSCCSETVMEDDYHQNRRLQKLARRPSEQSITSFGDDDLLRQVMPMYEDTIYQDREQDFVASRDCPFCLDKDRKRDVWGILIHPVEKSNTYYRVGVFLSRAIHGGSDIFAKAETGIFELI